MGRGNQFDALERICLLLVLNCGVANIYGPNSKFHYTTVQGKIQPLMLQLLLVLANLSC